MNNPDQWMEVQEQIRANGSDPLKRLLDKFHQRYLITVKHCWVPGARRRIMVLWEKEKAAKVMAPTSGTRYIESN